ncbi:formylglycine-generating enzyme family protein [Siculibacillus lacustris]|uniref:Formylglycine-generating enzyme family protein n=1 Tax=Siculibacillus lacustris TaxID=1549641 RepID=A0A4Q9VGW7_9HYPH|nr:SUMF1/EgtB/PvdO family nonheme iron enzyme [Siculibacillus lacustris]TBW33778.1 formylglycine-generating enzyme family protein [Siculibacillus lacustris]
MSIPRHRVLLSSGLATVVAVGMLIGTPTMPPTDSTDLVILPPTTVTYRAAGDFSRDGSGVDAPVVAVTFERPLAVMRTQVSAAAYRACVAAKACDGPDDADEAPARDDLPAVGLSWRDATAYAAWLSRTTGHHYRLPTDAEWVRLAAEAHVEETAVAAADPRDPARRWLAAYAAESAKAAPIDRKPRPFGHFGTNSHGLADVAGNVWEWTDGCWSRHVDGAGAGPRETRNCGVRVVEGRHRGYVSDFVRDPRSGGCSVGTPPSNLGARLIRDDPDLTLPQRLAALVASILPTAALR